MTEPEKTFFENDDGTHTAQIKMKILVDGKELDWFVGVGQTEQSLFGKLMIIGKEFSGLKGVVLDIIVSTTMKNGKTVRNYQVLNYIDIKKKNKMREENVQ